MGQLTPHPKVAASTFAGAVTVVLVWGTHQYLHVDLPADVASSLTVITSFMAGWMTPS